MNTGPTSHLTTRRRIGDLVVRRTQTGVDLFYDVLEPQHDPALSPVLRISGVPHTHLPPARTKTALDAIRTAFPETAHASAETIDTKVRIPGPRVTDALGSVQRPSQRTLRLRSRRQIDSA